MSAHTSTVQSTALDWKKHRTKLSNLIANDKLDQAADLAKSLAEQDPDSWVPYRYLLQVALAQQDLPAAEAAFQNGKARGAKGAAWKGLHFQLAMARQDLRAAVDIALSFKTAPKGMPGTIRNQAVQTARAIGNGAAAEQICDIVLRQTPLSAEWIKKKYRAFFTTLTGRAPEGALAERIFGPDGGPHHLLGLVLYARLVDTNDPQINALRDQAQKTWPDAPEIQETDAALHAALSSPRIPAIALRDATPIDTPDLPPELGDMQVIESVPGKSIQISPDRPSRDVLLAFFPGGRAITLFDRYAAALGMTAIYPQDANGLYGANGVAGLGADYKSSVEGMKTILSHLKPDYRLTILGLSGGNFGALNFAADLPTENLIVLAPVTCVDPEFQANIGDTRRPATLTNIAARIPTERRFPCNRLRQSPPAQTVVVYGADNHVDTAHAELMREVPNARLHPVPGTDAHRVQEHMIAQGTFLEFLRHVIQPRVSQ